MEQPFEAAVLEDEHENPHRRRQRQHVHHERLHRQDEGARREPEQDERDDGEERGGEGQERAERRLLVEKLCRRAANERVAREGAHLTDEPLGRGIQERLARRGRDQPHIFAEPARRLHHGRLDGGGVCAGTVLGAADDGENGRQGGRRELAPERGVDHPRRELRGQHGGVDTREADAEERQ